MDGESEDEIMSTWINNPCTFEFWTCLAAFSIAYLAMFAVVFKTGMRYIPYSWSGTRWVWITFSANVLGFAAAFLVAWGLIVHL